MLYLISWFFVLALLALWSLAVWALHGIAVWTVSNAGAWSGAASGLGGLDLPPWLAPWVPADLWQSATALLSGLGPLVDSLLQAVPSLAGGLTLVGWVVWGLGGVLLVVLGGALHLLIAMWRRRAGGGGGAMPRPGLAASR